MPKRKNIKISFGSMILDSVSYVGDVLSYYLDYSANESFFDSSIEYDNIIRHAKALGYNFKGVPSSFGLVSLYIIVPSNVDGTAPDTTYMPMLKMGTSFTSFNGGNFILTENVDFADPKNEIVAARFDSVTGATTFFAVRAYGQVQSGTIQTATADIRNQTFERFKKIRVGGPQVSEVLSVVDSEGNIYYEVDNLSQEVIFVETTNKEASSQGVRSILKPYAVSRRFVVQRDELGTLLQFGFGSDEEETNGIVDPSRVALKMHGRNYISSENFDPSKLIQTNKLGISPSNTILRITYRVNEFNKINVGSNTIRTVNNKLLEFRNPEILLTSKVDEVIASLEVNNDAALYSTNSDVSLEELRQQTKSYYASQSRAITVQDYESLIYNMPNKFGNIKRAAVLNNNRDSRKLNLYLISQDSVGNLATTDDKTKQNLKNWLTKFKSINDTIEIYNAKIINFAIEFTAVSDKRFSSRDALNTCIRALENYFSEKFYIGEPLYINRIYDILNKLESIVDVKNVEIKLKIDGSYSTAQITLNEMISKDGTFYNIPKNCIFELKYPKNDIKGTII